MFKTGYACACFKNVQIFPGVNSYLRVDMKKDDKGSKDEIIFPHHHLLWRITMLEEIIIPNTITVHLGRPDSPAENLTVDFLYYVKNVASSEIFPTWPYEALKANIWAQMSLVLNRVYTEWYRGRGYPFDITNSTAYDQAFVKGRVIY